jgi:hypothetical protein
VFPYYYETDNEELRHAELCDIEYKIVVHAQDSGYVAEVYYHVDAWKWFMASSMRAQAKEAVENLLCVSAALLQDANFNKGLPGFVGKAKCIRGGIFQEHPKK